GDKPTRVAGGRGHGCAVEPMVVAAANPLLDLAFVRFPLLHELLVTEVIRELVVFLRHVGAVETDRSPRARRSTQTLVNIELPVVGVERELEEPSVVVHLGEPVVTEPGLRLTHAPGLRIERPQMLVRGRGAAPTAELEAVLPERALRPDELGDLLR